MCRICLHTSVTRRYFGTPNPEADPESSVGGGFDPLTGVSHVVKFPKKLHQIKKNFVCQGESLRSTNETLINTIIK